MNKATGWEGARWGARWAAAHRALAIGGLQHCARDAAADDVHGADHVGQPVDRQHAGHHHVGFGVRKRREHLPRRARQVFKARAELSEAAWSEAMQRRREAAGSGEAGAAEGTVAGVERQAQRSLWQRSAEVLRHSAAGRVRPAHTQWASLGRAQRAGRARQAERLEWAKRGAREIGGAGGGNPKWAGEKTPRKWAREWGGAQKCGCVWALARPGQSASISVSLMLNVWKCFVLPGVGPTEAFFSPMSALSVLLLPTLG